MKKYFLTLMLSIITISSFVAFNYLKAKETESNLTSILSHEQAPKILSQKNENQEIEIKQHSTPEFLYKIISREEWRESLFKDQVVPSPQDIDFMHLATEDQVAHVVHKFWGEKDHIILKLASCKLEGRLVYEANLGGSTQYYHLYEGNIPLDAVVDVKVVRFKDNL